MRIIKTHDASLNGYKYCIADKQGEIISVLPTSESRAREWELIAVDGDSLVEILFTPYLAK